MVCGSGSKLSVVSIGSLKQLGFFCIKYTENSL